MTEGRLPDLIGCGAGKSGTTSLYYYLSDHPEIFMALAKEIHFFSWYDEKGLDWYRAHFANSGGARVVGEFSTTYMLEEGVPERMAEIVPEARLLFIFRNPVQRAYSNFWSRLDPDIADPRQAFSALIRTEEGQKKYLWAGFYARHLKRFLVHYDRRQIYVLFTEELRADPAGQMADCYRFLGVDPSFQPEYEKRFNVTVVSSQKWKVALDQFWLNMKLKIKPLFLWVPASVRKRFAEMEQVVRTNLLNEGRPEMDEQDRAYLTEMYRESNRQLADLLGRDLPWDLEY
jgi:hypothetical protein